MRKPIKTNFGSEVIFAQENWFTGSFLNVNFGRTTETQTADTDLIFYVDEGVAEFTINDEVYEFGYGKTVLIKKGAPFSITARSPLRIIKITQEILEDKDFSGGKQYIGEE